MIIIHSWFMLWYPALYLPQTGENMENQNRWYVIWHLSSYLLWIWEIVECLVCGLLFGMVPVNTTWRLLDREGGIVHGLVFIKPDICVGILSGIKIAIHNDIECIVWHLCWYIVSYELIGIWLHYRSLYRLTQYLVSGSDTGSCP